MSSYFSECPTSANSPRIDTLVFVLCILLCLQSDHHLSVQFNKGVKFLTTQYEYNTTLRKITAVISMGIMAVAAYNFNEHCQKCVGPATHDANLLRKIYFQLLWCNDVSNRTTVWQLP